MRIKYILAGCFALYLKAKSQVMDSTFQQRIIPKTEIEAVFSYYDQNGDHSAVTGGKGTEELTVYASSFLIKRSFKSYNSASLKLGADVITSASTDRIDDVISSASYHDTRTFANLAYYRSSKRTNLTVGLGSGISIESDYLSIPASLWLSYTSKNKRSTYDMALEAYFDDLRWGRLNPDYYRPVSLVYPKELRNREWFDIYRRNSYNLQLGFSQVVTKRLVIGVYPQFVYQSGLLSTPFHRVYFNDGTVKVENLPNERFKLVMGVSGKYFTPLNFIVKAGYRFYRDNFGIIAHSIDLETAIKVKPLLTLSPFVRYHHQTGVKYFKPHGLHNPVEMYYTSDYDLSSLNTFKLGVGVTHRRNHFIGSRLKFSNIGLRYAYYFRSDNLSAHIVTLVMNLETVPRLTK